MVVRRIALMALASLVLPGEARAALCGGFLNPVQVAASAMAFGSYAPGSASPLQATSTITLSCGVGLDLLPSFTVSISSGSSGSFGEREMAAGSNRLRYNIFTTGSHTTVWGDGSGGTATASYSSVLLLGNLSFTAYGLAPAGQWPAAGAYQDTLLVTVSY